MSVSFEVDISRVMAGMESMITAVAAANPDAFDEGSRIILDGARQVVPVKTGRLKNSLRVISRSPDSLVGGTNTVRYARIVHDGLGRGRNSRPRPYIKENVDRFQPQKPFIWLAAFRRHHGVTS